MRIVELKGLGHTYPDGTPALHNLTFTVTRGEIVSILGANGAGKTTLLKHLNALLQPTEGELHIAGLKPDRKNVREIRRKVGFLFQNPDDQVFSPTVLEDVMFGPLNMGHTREEAMRKAMKILQDLKIDGLADRPPTHLSYGQKKRVALAGVLVMEPEILVMDEPMAGLDYRGRRELMDIIKKLNENGVTIIFSTHLTERAAELSTKTLVLKHGKMFAWGETRDIITDIVGLKDAGLEPTDITALFLWYRDKYGEKDGWNTPLTLEDGKEVLKRIVERRQ